jgi:hypothetical protein
MNEYICIVGLDEPEYKSIEGQLNIPVIAHPILPRMIVRDGQLWIEGPRSSRYLPVSKVVFHGIFEDDLDFFVGLAFWDGPCLPAARTMMDCRLKLPCLVRAQQVTRFKAPRGYAAPYARFDAEVESVAKWGNWHCGENKVRFNSSWTGEMLLSSSLIG